MSMPPSTRSSAGLARWAALGGIAYVVLFIVGTILLFSGEPGSDASPAKVIAWYSDSGHRDRINIGWIVGGLGVFFFPGFDPRGRRRRLRAPRDRRRRCRGDDHRRLARGAPRGCRALLGGLARRRRRDPGARLDRVLPAGGDRDLDPCRQRRNVRPRRPCREAGGLARAGSSPTNAATSRICRRSAVRRGTEFRGRLVQPSRERLRAPRRRSSLDSGLRRRRPRWLRRKESR